jgi:hypothetical protein
VKEVIQKVFKTATGKDLAERVYLS